MTRVDQRFEHNPPDSIGDCHAACIATMLETTLDEVPRVKGASKKHIKVWWKELGGWLDDRGLYLFQYDLVEGVYSWLSPSRPKVWIAGGKSRRGGLHCVVMVGHEMFHDPHHSRHGLIDISFAEHLALVDPSKVRILDESDSHD